MAENTLDRIISFRVSGLDLAHIQAAGAALASPRSANDFARAATTHACRQKVPAPTKPARLPVRRKPTADVEALARVLAALGKVGSNLNQMARVANQRGALPTEATLRGIAEEVVATRNVVTAALSGEAPDGD